MLYYLTSLKTNNIALTHSYNGVIGITAKVEDTDFGYCYISISENGILINTEIPGENEYFIATRKTGRGRLSEYKISEMRKNRLESNPVLPANSTESLLSESIQLRNDPILKSVICPSETIDEDLPVTIDILVVYTEKARINAESKSQSSIELEIDAAIQRANVASENSKLGITFSLAYSYETDYEEVNSVTDLHNLTNQNDGKLDEVHIYRKQYNADLVMLVPEIEYTGGQGWLLGSFYTYGSPSIGFALARIQQLSWTTTMIHEIAHNMGCHHHKDQLIQPGPGRYPYSSGWKGIINSTNYCTIMTYESSQYWSDGSSYAEIPYFSNPDIIYPGSSVVIGDASTADNARTLRQTKLITSLYSDIINTSMTGITLRTGTLSPAFDPDITEYTVNVSYEDSITDITGTASYDCANVVGNQTNKLLNVGENNFILYARSHDNSVTTKQYKLKIIREAATMTDIVVSTGTLSPVFNPDVTEYIVEVPYETTSISITGIPSHSLAGVSGNQTDKSLSVGENIFTLSIYAKSYQVKVIRKTQACMSYSSRPIFNGNISASAGDNALNLNMNPAKPSTEFDNLLTLDLPNGTTPICIRASAESDACYAYPSNNYQGYIGTETIKVTQSGNYTFTANRALLFTLFSSETPSCEGFINSSAYLASDGTSFSCKNNISVSLNANTNYYIRTYEPSQTGSTVTFTLTGPGTYYTESEIPYGIAYTYIAVDQSDNKIKMQHPTGDFRSLSMGTYTIYGAPYSTSGTTNPTNFIGKTVGDIQSSDCIIPSSTFINITVTSSPVNAVNPVISGQPAGATYTQNAPATALTVTASVSDGGTLSYQWYSNTTNSTSGGTDLGSANGAQTYSYTPPTTAIGTLYYYVVITNTVSDTQKASTTSNIVPVEVNALTYGISFGTITGGSVSASSPTSPNGTAVLANEIVTLTITTTTGYELKSINVHKTGDNTTLITLSGSGNENNSTRTFTMPSYGVTVTASFGYTADQQTVSDAKQAIEGVSKYTLTQIVAYDEMTLKSALASEINTLLASSSIVYTVSTTDITVSDPIYATAGTVGNISGNNGSFSFTISLAKGNSATETTVSQNGVITATSYDTTMDNNDISNAKLTIQGTSYTDIQANVPNIAKAKETVENIINNLSISVITTVVDGVFIDAVAGTPGNQTGINGSYTFTVKINKGGGTEQVTAPLTLTITATPYDTTQDNTDISALKSAIEGATYTDTQTNIPTKASAKAKVEAIISALNINSVTTTVLEGIFTGATAGTAGTPEGITGSYTFTVKLNKGGGTEQVTAPLTLTIIATPYDATADNMAISNAKSTVQGATYTDMQVNVPNITKAKEATEAIISTLTLNGVTTTVVDGTFTAAIAGTAGIPEGITGSYTFTVKLNKGGGTEQETAQLMLTITATPYTPPATHLVNINATTNGSVSASPASPVTENATVTLTISPATGYEPNEISVYKTGDTNATLTLSGNGATRTFTMPAYDVTINATFKKTADQLATETAQGIIETMGSMIVNQATANTEIAVKAWLAQQINAHSGMSATGITVTVSDITVSGFNAATAGTATNIYGTNGSFTFIVSLKKNNSAMITTTSNNGTITATPYDALTYAVVINSILNGTVSANTTTATAGTMITLSILPATGYELDNINVTKTGDTNTAVSLSGSGTTRIFSMPAYDVTVNTTFKKTADQVAVENAQTAIESMSNITVAQATANTEAAVKAWLVQQINALSGISTNGIMVTVSDISISGFTGANAGTSGNLSGNNGSFSFTVSLNKNGSTTVTTAIQYGTITATSYIAPSFTISIATTSNGIASVNQTSAEAGKTITITVSPAQGYELESISTTPSLTLTGSGNTRTFVMPANNVTVKAIFKKTQAQLDKEAVEAAKNAIEGGIYRIAQATGNTNASVNTWLINTLHVMFGNTHNMQLRSTETPIVGDVAITSLTAAETGTESSPAGINGSFKFTVTLTRGATTLTATVVSGVIIATPHTTTPVKRIELLSLSELTTRILNTGNIETGNLTLTLSGINADAFILSEAIINSLAVGAETDITLSPRNGLTAGIYKATLTINGEGLTALSTEISYTVTTTGTDNPEAKILKAQVQNGLLHVNGLTTGKPWRIFNISGTLVYHGIASSDKATVRLSVRGVYVVLSEDKTIKVIY